MIKQIKVWIAECDRCKRRYTCADVNYSTYETKKELIDDLTYETNPEMMAEVWKITKNKALCEECK